MAFYRSQGIIETLSAKTELTSRYASDHRATVFGNRGGKYDELQYLRNQNEDAVNVNAKLSDAWQILDHEQINKYMNLMTMEVIHDGKTCKL